MAVQKLHPIPLVLSLAPRNVLFISDEFYTHFFSFTPISISHDLQTIRMEKEEIKKNFLRAFRLPTIFFLPSRKKKRLLRSRLIDSLVSIC